MKGTLPVKGIAPVKETAPVKGTSPIEETAPVQETAHARLNRLWQRGAQYLGVEHAILGGAMTWISERHLVSAISNAGAFGVIAAGSQMPDDLAREIQATREKTDRPFGVNVIIMHDRIDDLIAVCLKENIRHVILAGGMPRRHHIETLRSNGCHTLAFIPTIALGRKLVSLGVDGLIIEGMEAGGHTGAVSTSVLAQEILPVLHDVPIFVAGGIGRGDAMLSYLEMGASGCQIGTLFACAEESIAHDNFKKTLIRAKARDARLSPQLDPRFPVIPVRAIHNQAAQNFIAIQRHMIDEVDSGRLDTKKAQLKIEHFWAGALRRAVIDGDIEQGSLMAGQSVGMVRAVESTAAIIQRLRQQAEQALNRRI